MRVSYHLSYPHPHLRLRPFEKKNGLSASDILERIFTCGWIKGQRHPVLNLQASAFSQLQEGSREASSYPFYGERQKFLYSLTDNFTVYEKRAPCELRLVGCLSKSPPLFFCSYFPAKVQLRKVNTQKEGVILQLALQMAMWWHFVSWAGSSFQELPFKKSQCNHVALCVLILPSFAVWYISVNCTLTMEKLGAGSRLSVNHGKAGRWKLAQAPEGSVNSPCQFWSRV